MSTTFVVTGTGHTQRYLKGLPSRIHAAMAAATHEAASLLEERAQGKAPGRVALGIRMEAQGTRRFAGPFADSRMSVRAHVVGNVAEWYIGGTGIHKLPEYGGPTGFWFEGTKRLGSDGRPGRQKFEGLITGDTVFRSFTSHEGQPSRDVITQSVVELEPVITRLYEAAVRVAVSGG